MKVPVFTGSSVAIITPFCDGKIDFFKLGELIDFQIDGGTAAITICGTTGEASTLSLQEKLEAIDFCVRYTGARAKVIAGTGSNDTAEALYLSQAAESLGADAVLLVTPYYNKTTQSGLVNHYTYIADRIAVPLILYNVPGRTGMTISAHSYQELSKHPNINGVKEASGDIASIALLLAQCGPELNVWSGSDELVVPMMSLGAKGVISAAANIIPSTMSAMTSAALSGDFGKASSIQLRYMELIKSLFIEVNPIAVKAAMNLAGMQVGEPRMPLCKISSSALVKLHESMCSAGLLAS